MRDLAGAFAQVEAKQGGRLGIYVLDTASGLTAGHRADERFAMCSTFKFLLAAAILNRVDHAELRLEQTLPIPPAPLLGNSPLTQEHAGGEMTLAALCQATLTRSDNTAANLLLTLVGGPDGLTLFARSLGDPVTRLDRNEPTLNEATPGDPRDTTTPHSMVGNLRALLIGDALAPSSRTQLNQWLQQNKTGDQRLRAALPSGWLAGDKTGSDGKMTSNDIAIFWPPHRAPILVAAYLTELPGPDETRAAVLAEIGRLVIAACQNGKETEATRRGP